MSGVYARGFCICRDGAGAEMLPPSDVGAVHSIDGAFYPATPDD